MDWRKEIDQQLLMPIGKLIACLAFEAIRESPPSADEVLSGTVLSTSDMLGRHQRSILELLEKGCLLDKIQILRGGKQVLHDLQEVRSTIADIRSRAYRIALYRELDPGLPQVPDTSYTIATHEMAEISLSEQAMALEVVPGDVVRWMNSTHEGQILLPASLRAYLAQIAEQEGPSASETLTETAPQQQQPLEYEKHIEAWISILLKLRGAELQAAKLAIEKWRGKSHMEAYRAAIPDGCAASPKEHVSKKRATAEEIAKRYNLTMPNWRTGN